MTEFEKQIASMAARYDADVREIKRSLKHLATGERICAQTHANVKEAAVNELRRLMHRCNVKAGGRS